MAGDKGKMLTVAQILEAQDLEERVVDVPEWGGVVRVRGFTKAQQQQMRKQATVAEEVDSDRLELLMFVHGVVDPKFSPDQAGLLQQKSAGLVDRVLTAVLEVSGMTKDALKKAEKSFSDESGQGV